MWEYMRADATDLESAYLPLAQRAAEFGRAWSIAELRLQPPDLEWLATWFALLPEEASITRTDLLATAMARDKFAALLLVLGSERCRDHSRREDAVWPVFNRSVAQSRPLWGELFHASGQPTWLLKAALMEAVRGLNLRNVGDQEGTQRWYATIKLQFGFTFRGAKARLAEWLVGLGTPDTIQRLCGTGDSQELASRSFQSLWTTLRQYRRGDVDESQAAAILRSSPWVKTDWIDDLLAEARARIATLGSGAECVGGNRSERESVTPEERGPLEAIALSWPRNGKPRVVFKLDREAIADACAATGGSELDFSVDGQNTGRWILQPDSTWDGPGTVFADVGHDPADVNLTPKTLSIRTRGGEIVKSWELADFGLCGDYVIFDLDGECLVEVGEERLDPSGSYVLVCDLAYDLVGCVPTEAYVSTGSARRALRLPTPLTSSLRLSFGDFVIWQPVAQREREAERVDVRLHGEDDAPVLVGTRTRLVARGLPAGASEVRLLVGKHIIPMSVGSAGWVSDRLVSVTPELASKQLVMRVNYREDDHSSTVSAKLALGLCGIAALSSGGNRRAAGMTLTQLEPGQTVSKSASCTQLRIWVPDDTRALRVFEGHYHVGPLRHGRISLGDFSGLGGRIAVAGSRAHLFDNACIDSGCFSDCALLGIGGFAQLGLRWGVTPESQNHQLVAWCQGSAQRPRAGLVLLPQSVLRSVGDGRRWTVPVADDMLALALAWNGNWLGAAWRLERLLGTRFEASVWFFAALRWLRLPVLHPSMVEWLEPLVLESPFSFLDAWSSGAGLPEGIRMPDHEPARDSVLRQYIGRWRPSQEAHAYRAVQVLSGIEPRDCGALTAALDGTSRCSMPLLWWIAGRLDRIGGGALQRAAAVILQVEQEQLVRHGPRRLDELLRAAGDFCALGSSRVVDRTDRVLGWLDRSQPAIPQEVYDDLLMLLGSESARRYCAARVLMDRMSG